MAGAGIMGAMGLLALSAPLLAPADPFALVGAALDPPSLHHLMGTDILGRDLLSGVLYGARTSLVVAGITGALAFIIGTGTGLVAGYAGGWTDDVLMRLAEIVQVLPRFFFAVLAVALFGPGLDRIILALAITSWPGLARVVRAEVLALRTQDFVRAAEAAGASHTRIVMRELLPGVLSPAFVMIGLLLGQVLLLEASLGFLGLGDPNLASWGALISQGQPFLLVAWWLPLFPGLAITLTVLGMNLLVDAFSGSVPT
ncbi:MAG: ABC transporter permease [Longimicrobiales bacterium]